MKQRCCGALCMLACLLDCLLARSLRHGDAATLTGHCLVTLQPAD